MNQQNQKPNYEGRFDPILLKQGLKCNCHQYKFLKLCSERGEEGIKRWNKWREKHPDQEIWLEGQNFDKWYLEGVLLNKGDYQKNRVTYNFKGGVQLNYSTFRGAKLQHAVFHNARLQNTKFSNAHLGKAIFQGAHLQDANFYKAELYGANFLWVLLNNATSFIKIKCDKDTDFSCTGLNGIRIIPATKQLLEYNIRRKNWEKWYIYKDWQCECKKKRHSLIRILMYFVRWFWSFSDYGRSTWQIIKWFGIFAVGFALIYRICPNCIMVNEIVGDIRGFWHALYFSVVTMTTLGFGDIAANPDSWFGQTLLMIQVILGYVLLGALITRFAVLFTAGGPAGKFSEETKNKNEKIKTTN